MRKVLTIVVCLLLVTFATPVFADFIIVNEGNNIGCVYDEYNPSVRFYIKDLYKFFAYVARAVVFRNTYDYQTHVITQVYYLGKYMYKYEITCGEGLVFIYLYRPIDNEYLDEQGIMLSAEDIRIFEKYIEENGLPGIPKD